MQGKTINGFVLQRRLGKGGMAEVWYAENEIGMKAAVKIMSEMLAHNPMMQERFLNEAKVMVKLDHPNIRKVYGYGNVDDRPAIIMEYLDGTDLKMKMKSGERFTEEELEKWWNQLADALNYTHAQDVVHRDIKPSNIFIDQHGNAKLLENTTPLLPDKGHCAMLNGFIRAIREDLPSPCDEIAGFRATYLAQRAIEALELKRTLSVPIEKITPCIG